MAYLSLYRKWRPQTFEDVVGQEHVVRTLKNALDSRRVAHAYLFAGPRGTGKTTLARLLAKGLNCEKGPTGSPCNTCANCVRIARGTCVDVIEIDGASNRGIDEIRDVREMVKFAPAEGEYKVYIIDEVHMLTTEAFNALLKVLEEPPSHVVFVFATTEPHKIPATIVSRCQKFDFRALTPDEIVSQLSRVASREGVEADPRALALIARHSEGGMRDALSFLDQCIAFGLGAVTESVVAQVLGVVEAERLEQLAEALAARDLGRCLTLVKGVVDDGRDLRQFAADAVRYFRDMLVLSAAPESERFVAMPAESRRRAKEMAERFSLGRLIEIVETLGKAESDMRWASAPQLPLELALIELIKGEKREDTEELVRRIEALERRVAELSGSVSARDGERAGRGTARGGIPVEGLVSKSGDGASGSHGPPAEPEHAPPLQEQPEAAQSSLGAGGPAAEEHPVGEDAEKGARGAGGEQDSELLALVQSRWPRVLEQLRAARHIQQEAFLREGSPVAVQGDTVIVAFSPNHRFHQANMDKEKNRAIVEKVLSAVMGRPLRMRAVLGSEWKEAPPSPAATSAASAARPSDTETLRGKAAGSAVQEDSRAGQDVQGRQETSVPWDQAEKRREDESDSRRPQPQAHGAGGSAPQEREAEPRGRGEAQGSQEAIDPGEIDDPLVRAALRLFGGKITRIERTEAKRT